MAIALPEGPRGRALALALDRDRAPALWLAAGQPMLDAYADRADGGTATALAARMADVAASLPELQRAGGGAIDRRDAHTRRWKAPRTRLPAPRCKAWSRRIRSAPGRCAEAPRAGQPGAP